MEKGFWKISQIQQHNTHQINKEIYFLHVYMSLGVYNLKINQMCGCCMQNGKGKHTIYK